MDAERSFRAAGQLVSGPRKVALQRSDDVRRRNAVDAAHFPELAAQELVHVLVRMKQTDGEDVEVAGADPEEEYLGKPGDARGRFLEKWRLDQDLDVRIGL